MTGSNRKFSACAAGPVWRAISDADEFGRWFGVRFDGPFVAGASVTGVITLTTVDDDAARARNRMPRQGGHLADRRSRAAAPTGVPVAPVRGRGSAPITRRSRPRWWSSLWTETDDGVLLRIVESGFDKIPAERRLSAFEAEQRGLGRADRTGAKYLALSESVSIALDRRRQGSLFDALGDPNRLRIVTAAVRSAGRARRRKSQRWCR